MRIPAAYVVSVEWAGWMRYDSHLSVFVCRAGSARYSFNSGEFRFITHYHYPLFQIPDSLHFTTNSPDSNWWAGVLSSERASARLGNGNGLTTDLTMGR